MRTFDEIHKANPFLDLLGDGLYDDNGRVVGNFHIHRVVFSWTEQTEALEAAQYALALAGEGFKESHEKLYDEMRLCMQQHRWADHKRIEDSLSEMWKFRQEWHGKAVAQASARLSEITKYLNSIKEEYLEGVQLR